MTDTSTQTLSHWIAGQKVDGAPTIQSLNPSNTDDVVAVAPAADSAVVDQAVAAARAAQPGWASASPELRGDVLDRAAALMMAQAPQLGALLAREEGKTRAEGTGEVLRAARILRYFGGEALRRHGQTLSSTRPGLDVATYREPVGVCGLITPWNFPIAIPAWKAAPALAFGNTVVIKAADITPTLADALAVILAEAGLPPGVFNLVHGGAETGAALAGHAGLDAVSFTGSQRAGALVLEAASRNQTRVQLEMGGKNPLVVLADADPVKAAAIALDGGYFQTGQRCTASSRVIVEDGIYGAFQAALLDKMSALRVGPALAEGTQIGPAASARQFAQNRAYLDIAQAEGAVLVSGGELVTCETPGYFMRPALIAADDPALRINTEEVFGPIMSMVRVASYEHALDVANQGRFGLSAGIVTHSQSKARHFRAHVQAGMVMINLPTAGVDYHVPFGGVRGSSYGAREQGFAAVDFYTNQKTVYTGD